MPWPKSRKTRKRGNMIRIKASPRQRRRRNGPALTRRSIRRNGPALIRRNIENQF